MASIKNIAMTDLESPGVPQPRSKHNVKFSVTDEHENEQETSEWTRRKDAAATLAHSKANRHADRVRKHNSAPNSRRNSIDNVASPKSTPPMREFSYELRMTESVDSDDENNNSQPAKNVLTTLNAGGFLESANAPHSGIATPLEYHQSEYYVPRPNQYKASLLRHYLDAYNISPTLGSLPLPLQEAEEDAVHSQNEYLFSKLRAYEQPETDPRKKQDFFQNRRKTPASPGSHSGTLTPLEAAGSSGKVTPNRRLRWYKEADQWHYNPDLGRPPQKKTVAKLLQNTFNSAASPATPITAKQNRPPLSRKSSSASSVIDLVKRIGSSHSLRREAERRREELLRSANDRIASQEYIIRMCRALMSFGAP